MTDALQFPVTEWEIKEIFTIFNPSREIHGQFSDRHRYRPPNPLKVAKKTYQRPSRHRRQKTGGVQGDDHHPLASFPKLLIDPTHHRRATVGVVGGDHRPLLSFLFLISRPSTEKTTAGEP